MKRYANDNIDVIAGEWYQFYRLVDRNFFVEQMWRFAAKQLNTLSQKNARVDVFTEFVFNDGFKVLAI